MIRFTGVKIYVFVIGGVFVFGSACAAAAECRLAAVSNGSQVMFCKDEAGVWKPQAGAVQAPALSGGPSSPSPEPPLKASATYRGTYVIDSVVQPRPGRVRDLTGLLDVAINQALNTTTNRENGAIEIVAKFDGPAVTVVVSGTTLTTGEMIGLVQGGVCKLSNTGGNNGFVTYEGPCGKSGFSGTISGTTRRGQKYSGKFETIALKYIDQSQLEADRSQLKAECDAGKTSACVALDAR